MSQPSSRELIERLEKLNSIGVLLSAETDITRLLELILHTATAITQADGGTLYTVTPDKNFLQFEIITNNTLQIYMGGSAGDPILLEPIPLYLKNGEPNHTTVAAYSVLNNRTVNIEDVYAEEGFDVSGTSQFHKEFGYRPKSFLTVPMRNHQGEIIGLLQLINAQQMNPKKTVAFSGEDENLVESLASQAAVALTNRRLLEQMEELFESFIRLINTAIDEKSPYTGGHCQRVPELTMMLAEAADRANYGELASFKMTEKDRYELWIAGMLHDCGKITTPVHIVDKATKLEKIVDRMDLVEARFELIKKELELDTLKAIMRSPQKKAALQQELATTLSELDDDAQFLAKINQGGEFMTVEEKARVEHIARWCFKNSRGETIPLLTEDEIKNLQVSRGTLNDEDRQIVNQHIVSTINMLNSLPWPPHLKQVPEFAGGHHERMDGKGYPLGLTKEQMSTQARIIAIADVFEALTAPDRPYKPGKTLSESLKILQKMSDDSHIDSALLEVFLREKVYWQYASKFVNPAQIDIKDSDTTLPDLA